MRFPSPRTGRARHPASAPRRRAAPRSLRGPSRSTPVGRGSPALPGVLGAPLVILACLGAMVPPALAAGSGAPDAGDRLPTAWTVPVGPLAAVARHQEPPPDLAALRRDDERRQGEGLPPRFAVPRPVSIAPDEGGTWEQVDQATMLWRLRVGSPGALSLNLGFGRYRMPPGGHLFIYPAGGAAGGEVGGRGPSLLHFTDADNEEHGQLWTPVLLADEIVVEVTLPVKELAELDLELTSVNVGYRGFGELVDEAAPDKAGTCNVDVICPEGDPWRDEIPSVGVISTGGSTFCTGFMVNNTAQDERPLFMTANHCGIDTGNAASLVVYWNFQSPECGQQGGGSLDQYQTGSILRATFATSDFTLVELDDPPDSTYAVSFAGWSRSAADPTSATAIHHPNTDEKSISFEYDPTQTTSYLSTSAPGDGTHIRIVDWDVGTTEPGSSGSPLFDQDHHVVGQLHGGYAACGNDDSDWYGRLSVSWEGGGTSATRLRDWLDPLGSDAVAVDTYNPHATGLRVLPWSDLAASGDPGGPFIPADIDYTLENLGGADLAYGATADVDWLTITGGSGTLGSGGTGVLGVAINEEADLLPVGVHLGTVDIVNLTDHDGDTQRTVRLQVGLPQLVHDFPLDEDPGWTMTGDWEFGVPLGGGGQYGGPDPTSGHTGDNVYGYDLADDYPNRMPDYSLTSGAIDCSTLQGVSLVFWRWLGVEQPLYDHAQVLVSNDGQDWTLIWENGGTITDTEWTRCEYDISAVADEQPAVYLRWVMGPTDTTWRYCGWNIDDIQIWGLVPAAPPPLLTGPGHAPAEGHLGTDFSFSVTYADPEGQPPAAISAVSLRSPLSGIWTDHVLAAADSAFTAGVLYGGSFPLDEEGTYAHRFVFGTADGRTVTLPADPDSSLDGPVVVDLTAATTAVVTALLPPAPNPANPGVVLRFHLAREASVDLVLYDLAGRRVRRLLTGRRPAGTASVTWDGRDAAGRAAPSGVYLVRLSVREEGAAGRHWTAKLNLVR